MSLTPKKQTNKKPQASKLRHVPSWLRLIIRFLYELSTFHIGAVIVSLIIIMIIGDLFPKYGLLLVLGILLFFLLRYLVKRFEELEGK